mmetsp:Transcript_94445/g.225014  ORF Transcript_94445/g.225014 Transcript_94445/m.225014 type:complete len:554 (-) Transcript_94445:602-2263(-)
MKLNRNVLGLLKGCEAQLPASGLEHNVVCARDEGLPLRVNKSRPVKLKCTGLHNQNHFVCVPMRLQHLALVKNGGVKLHATWSMFRTARAAAEMRFERSARVPVLLLVQAQVEERLLVVRVRLTLLTPPKSNAFLKILRGVLRVALAQLFPRLILVHEPADGIEATTSISWKISRHNCVVLAPIELLRNPARLAPRGGEGGSLELSPSAPAATLCVALISIHPAEVDVSWLQLEHLRQRVVIMGFDDLKTSVHHIHQLRVLMRVHLVRKAVFLALVIVNHHVPVASLAQHHLPKLAPFSKGEQPRLPHIAQKAGRFIVCSGHASSVSPVKEVAGNWCVTLVVLVVCDLVVIWHYAELALLDVQKASLMLSSPGPREQVHVRPLTHRTIGGIPDTHKVVRVGFIALRRATYHHGNWHYGAVLGSVCSIWSSYLATWSGVLQEKYPPLSGLILWEDRPMPSPAMKQNKILVCHVQAFRFSAHFQLLADFAGELNAHDGEIARTKVMLCVFCHERPQALRQQASTHLMRMCHHLQAIVVGEATERQIDRGSLVAPC